MEEKQMFKIKDENGIELDAELLATFEMESKLYAIYSTDVQNEEMSAIYSAELILNDDGTSDIKSIEDPAIKAQITNMVDSIINN